MIELYVHAIEYCHHWQLIYINKLPDTGYSYDYELSQASITYPKDLFIQVCRCIFRFLLTLPLSQQCYMYDICFNGVYANFQPLSFHIDLYNLKILMVSLILSGLPEYFNYQ